MEMFWNLSFLFLAYFSSIFLLKTNAVRLRNHHEFSKLFLCGQPYRFKDINDFDLMNFQIQAHHTNISEGGRDLFILMDFVITFIHFRRRQLSPLFIDINCCFSGQVKIGHRTSKFTETKVHFMRFFAVVQTFLFLEI